MTTESPYVEEENITVDGEGTMRIHRVWRRRRPPLWKRILTWVGTVLLGAILFAAFGTFLLWLLILAGRQ